MKVEVTQTGEKYLFNRYSCKKVKDELWTHYCPELDMWVNIKESKFQINNEGIKDYRAGMIFEEDGINKKTIFFKKEHEKIYFSFKEKRDYLQFMSYSHIDKVLGETRWQGEIEYLLAEFDEDGNAEEYYPVFKEGTAEWVKSCKPFQRGMSAGEIIYMKKED